LSDRSNSPPHPDLLHQIIAEASTGDAVAARGQIICSIVTERLYQSNECQFQRPFDNCYSITPLRPRRAALQPAPQSEDGARIPVRPSTRSGSIAEVAVLVLILLQ